MAGEPSGDIHGAILVNSLKKMNDNLEYYGVGGSKLEEEGVSLLYNYSKFSTMGFVEPLLKFLFYQKVLRKIIEFIKENEIFAVILIDFPGFNLLLAERIKKIDIKVLYYISPQIWAWHYSRIKRVKKFVDAIIVLYPFEEELYRKEGIKSFFVGNPLVDIVNDKIKIGKEVEVDPTVLCIGVLPGSRISEAKRHLQPLLDAARLLRERYACSFLIPVLNDEAGNLVEKKLENISHNKIDIQIIYDNTCRVIEKSDILIVSSGTVTLETAILKKPIVVIYKVGFLSELIARMVIKVENIALVNIIAGKKICPELLQRDVSGKKIYNEISKILDNKWLYNDMIEEMKKVSDKLGKTGAVKRIAEVILSLIYE